ncbi:hypothetical protein KC571_01795 [candidate division WWE3 bacterium]|uniref:Uncharacterized protein n=1 Tax=candidate division WWE3 bacterium TaxID=2053526 RepID=A0A955LGE3_UNCKA|nr:hypothetical protein [candidate division WWE3 bacterium]
MNQSNQMMLTSNDGAVLVLVAILLAVSIVLTGYLWERVANFVNSENQAHLDEEILAITEAGLDKAIWSLNANDAYAGETSTSFGDGQFTISVVSIDSNTRQITATGYIPDSVDPIAQKTISIEALKSSSTVNFSYAMQSAAGGITMYNNAGVNGDVYSNGSIYASNNAFVNGDVWIAGGSSAPTINQSHETNNGSYQFGHSSQYRDIAQSFVPTTTGTINEVEVYLRKQSNPSNLTLRIAPDDGGQPDDSDIASGTLQSSWVTSSLSWISVDLTSTPTLNAGQTYWIILDGGNNSSRYYYWGSDSAQGYANGQAMRSSNWNNQNWSSINRDLNFRVYMGGTSGNEFDGAPNVHVYGDLHANHIQDVTISGDAYYQSINNASATNYYPGSTDPSELDLPISDADVQQWKDDAENGGTHSGDYTACPSTIGPMKITGNLILGNNCTLTVTGTLWIEGNMTSGNTVTINLDSGYGANGGIIIVDGDITPGNTLDINGSGQSDSYVMLISTNATSTAISTNNNLTVEGILYAMNGTLDMRNNVIANEVVAQELILQDNVVINYNQGLTNATFSSSASGSGWAMRDGTWQQQ